MYLMLDRILPASLCRIHQTISKSEHFIDRIGWAEKGNGPNAKCHRPSVLLDDIEKPLLQLLANYVGWPWPRLREQDDELVTPDSGNHVNCPTVLLHRLNYFLAFRFEAPTSEVKPPHCFHIQSRAPGTSQTHRNPIKMCRAPLTRPWRAAALQIPG